MFGAARVVANRLAPQQLDHSLGYTVLMDDGKKTFWPPPAMLFTMLDELLLLTATGRDKRTPSQCSPLLRPSRVAFVPRRKRPQGCRKDGEVTGLASAVTDHLVFGKHRPDVFGELVPN